MINTAVTGTAVATQAQQETGTATDVLVTPGRQHYHPSAVKAWGLITAPTTVSASYPAAGVSVNNSGTGVYVVTHGRTMSSVNYSVVVTNGLSVLIPAITAINATTFTVTFYDVLGVATAATTFHYHVVGDL